MLLTIEEELLESLKVNGSLPVLSLSEPLGFNFPCSTLWSSHTNQICVLRSTLIRGETRLMNFFNDSPTLQAVIKIGSLRRNCPLLTCVSLR